MADQKYAVVSNSTGAVLKYGTSDFTGQFDAGNYTQYELEESAHFISGLPTYYHKVVGAQLVEMTAGEKTAASSEQDAIKTSKLKGAARVTLFAPNLAALPLPPPAMGYLVGIVDVGGSPALAISTNTGYVVFNSDQVYT